MSERISRLCAELRIKLHGIDRRLEALKANGVATFDKSHDVLESQLDRATQRIYDNRITVEAANVRVKAWLAEKKAGSVADRALRTERHKAHLLQVRADDAEAYTIAVFELATAAADEATLAVLQAVLARNERLLRCWQRRTRPSGEFSAPGIVSSTLKPVQRTFGNE